MAGSLLLPVLRPLRSPTPSLESLPVHVPTVSSLPVRQYPDSSARAVPHPASPSVPNDLPKVLPLTVSSGDIGGKGKGVKVNGLPLESDFYSLPFKVFSCETQTSTYGKKRPTTVARPRAK